LSKYQGSCLCGAVAYEANGEPVFQFNCHCRDCQKSTGCAYAPIMFFPRDALRLTGPLTYHSIRGGSGQNVTRGFCGRCGAQVVGDVEIAAPLLSIRAGTLDDPTLFRPRADIFVTHAAAWDAMDPGIPKFERMPPRRG
jgi:hypothetical protein